LFTKTKPNNTFNFSFDHTPYDHTTHGDYFEYQQQTHQNFSSVNDRFGKNQYRRQQFYNKEQDTTKHQKNNLPLLSFADLLQILIGYYFFIVSAYKEFFNYIKKKFINEDVSLVMNRLSLMGLLFSLMLLGVVFFLAGFLVSSSLNNVKKEQEKRHNHQPSETALLGGVPPSSIRMPKDADNLVSEKYSRTGNIVMHGYKRIPTHMKKHRSQESRQIRHIPKPQYVDQNNNYHGYYTR
jgi:hypothetical protein